MELSKEEQEAIKMLDKFATEHKLFNIKYTDGLEKNIEIVLKMIKDLLWKEEQQKELLKYKTDKIQKQSKVIDETTKEIENMTGSCPLDRFDFNDIDCENKCNTGIEAECWKQYFYRKVEWR